MSLTLLEPSITGGSLKVTFPHGRICSIEGGIMEVVVIIIGLLLGYYLFKKLDGGED